MSRWKIVTILVVVGLLSAVWIGRAFSQAGRPEVPGRPEAPAGRAGRRRFDPEQMRQRMVDRMKEALGATDEEWKVLGPRVEKVQTLSFQLRGGLGMGGMFVRRAPRGETPEAAAPAREPTQVEKALQELRTVLDNKEAKPEEIKAKLTALREAREKVKQELAKAQKELRELLTLHQEAQLVLMGLLD